MTLIELLWVLPLAVAIALAMGAAGRDTAGAALRAAAHTLWTLVVVVGGVAVAVRVLIWLFV